MDACAPTIKTRIMPIMPTTKLRWKTKPCLLERLHAFTHNRVMPPNKWHTGTARIYAQFPQDRAANHTFREPTGDVKAFINGSWVQVQINSENTVITEVDFDLPV
jgi:hypothetical protein